MGMRPKQCELSHPFTRSHAELDIADRHRGHLVAGQPGARRFTDLAPGAYCHSSAGAIDKSDLAVRQLAEA